MDIFKSKSFVAWILCSVILFCHVQHGTAECPDVQLDHAQIKVFLYDRLYVHFNCKSGYLLANGPPFAWCQKTGEWTSHGTCIKFVAPTGLTAINGGEGEIFVNWAPVDGINEYKVKCRRSPSPDSDENINTAASTMYTIKGLQEGLTYNISVASVLNNKTIYSSPVTIKTPDEDTAMAAASDISHALRNTIADTDFTKKCGEPSCPERVCPATSNVNRLVKATEHFARTQVCRIDPVQTAKFGGLPIMERGPLDSKSTKVQEVATFLLFKEWAQAFKATLQATKTTQHAWLAKTRLQNFTDISQLDDLYNFFMNNYTVHPEFLEPNAEEEELPEGFWQRDNATDPFHSINQTWNNEAVFSQSRLMATNPVQIQRVTPAGDPTGMSVDKLRPLLNNRGFRWNDHIRSHIGMNFMRAVNQQRLYVLDYPLLAQVTADPHATSAFAGKKMLAPIALFVATNNQSSPFETVAIQLGRNSSAPVYTPRSGYFWWTIAKMYVNSADGLVSQIAHHLVNAHLVSEVFVAATCRELASSHPVHSLLSPHFQGLIGINTQGFKLLTSENGAVTKIAGFGYEGMGELINLTYQHWTWNQTDFVQDLKNRGMYNDRSRCKRCQRLLYYPYRDDGMLLYKTLNDYVTKYVNNYYCTDMEVMMDDDIQRWAQYISTTHQNKGFPSSITTKAQLTNILLRIIWVNTIHHAILNFPVKEFGAYVPAIAYTLRRSPSDWAEDAEAIRQASPENNNILLKILPDISVAVAQTATASQLASLRLHGLLDHHDSFKDPLAHKLTEEYRAKLMYGSDSVQAKISKRNTMRQSLGLLAYRYMQPKYLPNSIVI